MRIQLAGAESCGANAGFFHTDSRLLWKAITTLETGVPPNHEHRADFGPGADWAMRIQGPAMIEVDMTVIGAHPPYFPYSAAR